MHQLSAMNVYCHETVERQRHITVQRPDTSIWRGGKNAVNSQNFYFNLILIYFPYCFTPFHEYRAYISRQARVGNIDLTIYSSKVTRLKEDYLAEYISNAKTVVDPAPITLLALMFSEKYWMKMLSDAEVQRSLLVSLLRCRWAIRGKKPPYLWHLVKSFGCQASDSTELFSLFREAS